MLRVVAALAAVLACAFAAATSAAARTPTFIVGSGCDEHQAFMEGDEAAVAARLPERYTPVRQPNGRPLIFVRALRCRSTTLGGRSVPTINASYGMVIDSPDGRGCASGGPNGGAKGDMPPICNWYTLGWLTNDRRTADWLRAGTPFPGVYAPGLSFELGDPDPGQGGAPFHFVAPGKFRMDAITQARPGEIPIRVGYWADSAKGRVKLAGTSENLGSGNAAGDVTAAPGSDVAALMGAPKQPYLPDYSAFGAERIGFGVYRKQVDAPAKRLDRFEGSCAVQGDVTFDPPATNDLKPLHYSYDGAGKCSGTVNGRSVTDAPVKWHQAGPADPGSCVQARTAAPGQGWITFVGGPTIRFTLDFTGTGTELDGTAYGERWGTAVGHGSFATQRTPADITLQCGGEGVRKAPMDMSLHTQTPLISQHAAPKRSRPHRRLASCRHGRGHRRARPRGAGTDRGSSRGGPLLLDRRRARCRHRR